MSRRYQRSRSHAIKHHQSGDSIADKISAAILLTGLIAILYSLVSYSNERDSKALGTYSSFPSRPEEAVSPDAGRTLIYLDEIPPTVG